MVINYKKAMEYPLSQVPLSIVTATGGTRTTSKSMLLDIINATLTVPPNSPKLVISIDTTKPSTLIVDLIAAIRAMTEIPETYKQLACKFLAALPKGYYRIDLLADMLWLSLSWYFDSNHDKFPSFKNTNITRKLSRCWNANRFISLKKMVAFYLAHVSTMLLISNQTMKKLTVKSYCTAWNQKQQWSFVLLLEIQI